MKRDTYRSVGIVILLVVGLAALLAACAGGEAASEASYSDANTAPAVSTAVLVENTTVAPIEGSDNLSTFESKDPFVYKGTSTTAPPTTQTTAPNATTSTTKKSTPTTKSTTPTTKAPTTPTTKQSTTTTTHVHSLTILSIGTVGDAPTVTFKVDGTTYKDLQVPDVVSTPWGDVQVVDIDPGSKVVTLLHGSETLILGVGDVTFE